MTPTREELMTILEVENAFRLVREGVERADRSEVRHRLRELAEAAHQAAREVERSGT